MMVPVSSCMMVAVRKVLHDGTCYVLHGGVC